MPRLIGIDLGASAVKFTVVRSSGRKLELEDRFAVPVPRDTEEGGAPSMAARLATVAELVRAHPEWQQPANTVVLGWSSASTRRLKLPFTDKSQIERTLSFAVEAEVPFDLEDMVLGWRVLSQDTNTELIVCLADHDRLADVLGSLSAQKVDPRYVHFDADVSAAHADPELVTAVVDVGHAHTTLTVTKGGVAHLCRSIDVGGMAVTAAIAKALDVEFEEAERIKLAGEVTEGAGIPPAESGAAWEALPDDARRAANDVLGVLLAEIRATLVATEDELGVGIDEVRLAGGGARLAPLAGYLAADLGVPVRPAMGFDGDKIASEFALADALVSRAAGRTKGAEINLRTGDLTYRGGIDVLRATVIYGGAGAAFFVLAAIVIFGFRYTSLSSELEDTEARIQDLVVTTLPQIDPSQVRNTTTATAILKEEVARAEERARFLGSSNGAPPTVDLLATLTKAFPPPAEVTVDVTELTITPNNISFTAETDSYASADKVEASLQAVDRFKDAVKGNERTARDKVSFPVTIPLTPEDEELSDG